MSLASVLNLQSACVSYTFNWLAVLENQEGACCCVRIIHNLSGKVSITALFFTGDCVNFSGSVSTSLCCKPHSFATLHCENNNNNNNTDLFHTPVWFIPVSGVRDPVQLLFTQSLQLVFGCFSYIFALVFFLLPKPGAGHIKRNRDATRWGLNYLNYSLILGLQIV